MYGHGTPRRDFTYIDDIVDGIVAALALGADEEVFNLVRRPVIGRGSVVGLGRVAARGQHAG